MTDETDYSFVRALIAEGLASIAFCVTLALLASLKSSSESDLLEAVIALTRLVAVALAVALSVQWSYANNEVSQLRADSVFWFVAGLLAASLSLNVDSHVIFLLATMLSMPILILRALYVAVLGTLALECRVTKQCAAIFGGEARPVLVMASFVAVFLEV